MVDQRSDERFAWPLQTRPFRITAPGAYAEYRLRLKMPARAELAEIELLGD
ncbi:alpha-mannosidase [Xanthomonas citri pv. thirumalacharii]|nr:alpha-mannosidase [Xanthomonas citri pv. thirumalacharii]